MKTNKSSFLLQAAQSLFHIITTFNEGYVYFILHRRICTLFLGYSDSHLLSHCGKLYIKMEDRRSAACNLCARKLSIKVSRGLDTPQTLTSLHTDCYV